MKRFETEKELKNFLRKTGAYNYKAWSIRLDDPKINSKAATKVDIERYVISEIEKQHANDDDSVCYCVLADELTKNVFDLYIYHSKELFNSFRELETIKKNCNNPPEYYSVDYLTWGKHTKSLGKKMDVHHDGFGNELNIGDTFVDMKIGQIAKIDELTNKRIAYHFDDGYETTVAKSNALLLKSVKGIVPNWNK